MPINPDALGAHGDPIEHSWGSKDCLLYALGVGAGADDPTGSELEFTTENTQGVDQAALPTQVVVLGIMGGRHRRPLVDLGDPDFARMVHGEQRIELHQVLPVEATGSTTSTITSIADKGSAALVEVQATTVDASTGAPLFDNTSKLFFRGEGGWGGDRGSSERVELPETQPDHVVSYTTRPDQALLYRLNGDRNPLHSDPSFAALGGFDQPILHGLCSFGFTGRALLHAVCDSDTSRFHAMSVRFSAPVFPGEQLDVHIWKKGSGTALFRTMVGDRIVIDSGVLDHS